MNSIEGHTILVVDDTLANLDILFRHLKEVGLIVLVARDGMGAVRQAIYAQPDIILLDVMMPEIDGFETCRRLKGDPSTREIPVIFMTALSDTESKVRGFEVGAVDYITKPIEYKEVLARVNTHLTLRNLQKGLQAEIAERKKAESELQARNEELDAFAHTVAHDLKNPLGALTGIAEILAEDYGHMPPDDLKEYLESIARSGRKARNIIEELLILSGVRNKEVQVRPLNMAEIVTEAQQRLVDTIQEAGATIIRPDSWPSALGQPLWIEQVWVNYLSNALKYGGDPPYIEVGATPQANGMICFWVKDNGPGLTIEEQRRLFLPFTQLNQVRARGHGLGLSIVRRIVEKLDGSVAVAGQPGQGSIFSFTLPAVDPDES